MRSARDGAAVLAVLALGASGCASGGSSDARGLARTTLIARADVICRRLETMLRSITIAAGSIEQDTIQLLPPLVAYERTALTALGELAPSASMRNDWGRIVTDLHGVFDNTASAIGYARSYDVHELVELEAQSSRAIGRIQATAGRDGFDDCARLASWS
jgi:hypothetical protein